jgi:hypothetical protein
LRSWLFSADREECPVDGALPNHSREVA